MLRLRLAATPVWLSSYGIALLTVGVALGLMLALDPLVQLTRSPFLLFFGAVIISAWQAGIAAGLVATGLSAIVSNFFFFEPQYSFALTTSDAVRLLVFIAEGMAISYLCGPLRLTHHRLDRSLLNLQVSQASLGTAHQQICDILESIADGFFILDPQWRFTYINRQAEQVLGRSRHALMEKSIWALFPDLQETLFEDSLQRSVAEQARVVFETTGLLDPTQQFEVHVNPIHEGVAIYFQEVTQRKQDEEFLRLSENRYRTLANAVPQMMWVNDTAGNPIFFNDRWLEYTGIAVEVTLKHYLATIHPEDADLEQTVRSHALDIGEAYEAEYRLRRFDHSYRWHLVRVVPLQDDSKKVIQWVGTATDIDDVKKTEAALRLSEATAQARARELETFMETVPAAVWIAQDAQCTEMTANRAAHDLVSLSAGSVITATPADGSYPFPFQIQRDGQLIPLPELPMQKAGLTGEAVESEFDFVFGNGEIRSIWGRAVPLKDDRQRVQGVIGAFLNITERKQAEREREELLQRERKARAEAEAANRIKDEFLAVLSHELRSPLNPILGWAKLLRGNRLDEAARDRALETIERNAQLQSQLIEDLLDVSRILQGKLMLNVVSVDLVSVIEAALETVRLAAAAKGIAIQTQLAPDVGWVTGDAGRLQQVVWNLLSNAVKFTPTGGQVTVQLTPLEERPNGTAQVKKYAQITVFDTGKGISPAFLPHLFEYFRQEDGRTTRKFGGLGLGLAIVKHLVELHGGTIEADSPGEELGATFTVKLPVTTPSKASPDPPPTPSVTWDLSYLRILVVDDEADVRDLMVALLTQYQAEVKVASSAAEALDALAQFHPDLLISDIAMPEVDGYTLIQQIRRLPPEQGSQVPAIALTAHAGAANQQSAIAAGFQQHLAKPISPEDLIQAVVTLLPLTP